MRLGCTARDMVDGIVRSKSPFAGSDSRVARGHAHLFSAAGRLRHHDYDTTTKAGLYARAGIADYWVFDVARRRIIVHRSPVDGTYQSLTVYDEHEAAIPLAAPDSALLCSDLFA